MRPLLTLSLALLAVGSLRAESPVLDGTMPEDYLPALGPLLKVAVDRAPTTIAASISVAAAEAAVYASDAGLWPAVSGSVYYQEQRQSESNVKAGTVSGVYYNAQAAQPLFAWDALKNQSRIGRLQEKVAERNFAEAYRLLAVSIREQYIALIGKKILLRNAQFGLKLSSESLAAQQARFEAGSSSQAELSSFRMATEQAQLDTDRAQEDYNYSRQVFLRLVGIDTLAESSVPLELPHAEYSSPKADAVLTGFVSDGVESSFQNEVYRMYVREAELNYSIAKVRLLPKIQAVAAFSYQDYTTPEGNKIGQVGLETESGRIEADWTIFDGFATRGAKLSALASKRAYERQRETYVDTTIDQITYMRHQLAFSARAMAIAEVHTALIDAEVKRLGQDQGLGYASQASIDSGVLTLYATQYQQHYARSDFWSRWTEFVSLAGDDPALANLSSRYVR